MRTIEISQKHEEICPRCGAKLYVEVWEARKLVHLMCESNGCDYEMKCQYEIMKFCFTYRDEFTTEVEARDYEEATKKAEEAQWKRTAYDLWDDYLDANYWPVVKEKEEKQHGGALEFRETSP